MWKYVRIPNVCIIGSMQKKAYDFITTLKFLDFFHPQTISLGKFGHDPQHN